MRNGSSARQTGNEAITHFPRECLSTRAKSANVNGYRIVEIDVAEVRIGKGYRVGLVGTREINLFAPEQRAYNANIFPKFRHFGRRVS